jgi:hypothetical protein
MYSPLECKTAPNPYLFSNRRRMECIRDQMSRNLRNAAVRCQSKDTKLVLGW